MAFAKGGRNLCCQSHSISDLTCEIHLLGLLGTHNGGISNFTGKNVRWWFNHLKSSVERDKIILF